MELTKAYKKSFEEGIWKQNIKIILFQKKFSPAINLTNANA